MSSATSTPDAIWIVTEEISETSTTTETSTSDGSRGSSDVGGVLGSETTEEIVVKKNKAKLLLPNAKLR